MRTNIFFHKKALLVAMLISTNIISADPNSANSISQINETVTISDVAAPLIPNAGQYPEEVKYVAKTFVGEVLITSDNLTYIIPTLDNAPGADTGATHSTAVVLRETFVNANNYQLNAGSVSAIKANFFNNSAIEQNELGNVTTYNDISTTELWPRISLTLRAGYANIEKIFQLEPGSSPEMIAMKLEGLQNISLGLDGELDLNTEIGSLSFSKPVAWQEVNGAVQSVEISYRIIDNSTYGFNLGNYDPSLPLLIDPLISATYIGGSSNTTDNINGIARDSSGNIYVVGTSASTAWLNPPSAAPYPAPGVGNIPVNQDIVVFKLNSGLNSLISWAVLGSAVAGNDVGNDIAVSAAGDVYILGSCTASFVAAGGYDTTFGGGTTDICVIKLNSGLTSHIASTYLGAVAIEVGSSIAFDDANDRVVILGTSAGVGFPMACTIGGACTSFQNATGGSTDFVLAVLNAGLTSLLSSTYFGGAGAETVNTSNQLILDPNGNIIFTGTTASSTLIISGTGVPTSLATAGAYDTSAFTVTDAIVAKFSPSLSTTSRLAASFFADTTGVAAQVSRAVIQDSAENIYLTGTTSATGLPITYGTRGQVYAGGAADIYVAKLNSNLTSLLASSYFGDVGVDTSNALAFDAAENLLIGGLTTLAISVPPTACYPSFSTANEGIVIKIGSDLSSNYSASYFGGSGTTDDINDLLVHNGIIHFAGSTTSPGLFGGYDINNNTTGIDGFIARMDGDLCVAPSVTNITATVADGTYGIGDVIPIEVTFSTTVNALGIPTLTLETGTSDQVVNYSTGTGTDTLVFNYTVTAGDSSLDLDYLSAVALLGSVQSLGTTAADLALPNPGNQNSLSNNKNIVIDGIAPAAPLNFSPSSGNFFNTDTPSISGQSEAQSLVEVKDGLTVLCSDTADNFGAWSCTSSSLSDGDYNLTVIATDVAGNQGSTAAYSLTIDTSAPNIPVINAPANGQTTNDNTPLIAGTSDALAAVTVQAGLTTLCSTTANAIGDWSCASSSLIDGLHSITATASDDATNTASSIAINFTVDTVAPMNVAVSLPTNGSITADSTPTLSGTAENGSSINVKEGLTTLCSTTAAAGVWSCTSSALSHGGHNIFVEATDLSLNVSTSNTSSFSVDLIAPAAPVVSSPANNFVTDDTTPLFSGTAEASATISVYDGATLLGTTTASNLGTWSYAASSELSSGTHTMNFLATDAVGNQSSTSSLIINIVALSASGCSPTSITTAVSTLQSQAQDLNQYVKKAKKQNTRLGKSRTCSKVNLTTKNNNITQGDQLYQEILNLTADSSLPQSNIYSCVSVPSGCTTIATQNISDSLNAKSSQLENLVNANLGNCSTKTSGGQKTARKVRRLVADLKLQTDGLPKPMAQCVLP